MIEYLLLTTRNINWGEGPLGFLGDLADRSFAALQGLLGGIGGGIGWAFRYVYAQAVNHPYYVLIGLTLVVVLLVFSSITRR